MTATSRLVVAAAAALLAACAGSSVDHGGFRRACAELLSSPVAEVPTLVRGRAGWIYHVTELRYAAAGPFWGELAAGANPSAPPHLADPLPAVLHFHRELRSRGVELVFMPVPVRPAIYPEGVLEPPQGDDPGDLLPSQTALLEQLRREGVTVVDLGPLFRVNRRHPRGTLFVPSDTHWTPAAVVLAAEALARELADRPWRRGVSRLHLDLEWVSHEHFGAHYRELGERTGESDLEADRISLRRVLAPSPSGLEPLELRHPDSPVVVIGDSNTIWWKQFESALPHQLAAELGLLVDVLSTTGGGANETRLNLRREIQADPGYLEGKRVVVWCFSSRSFTNTREGWLEIGL